jgi:NIPSNAP protein
MIQKSLLLVVVIVSVFILGFWLGKTMESRAEGKNRVFELRTYTANEGKLEALHARFRNHTTELFKKHGMTNIGYWSPKDAPLSQNTLVYVLAYPSREAASKSWDNFRNDAEWKKVKQESEANGELVKKVDSVYMDPTDYSPMR